MNTFIHGFGFHDGIQLLARLLLGGFFVLARFRFFYDPSKPEGTRFLNTIRHTSLTNKMAHCGFTKPSPYAYAWFVASVEVLAGFGVFFGLFTMLSALGLFLITLIGTRCTAYDKVVRQNPVDKIDVCSDYLWLAEPLYIGLSIAILLGGPGSYSLDAVIFG